MRPLALIDYGAGNLKSVDNALRRLGVEATITRDPEQIRQAERVIFPGVGAAASAMEQLRKYGLDLLIPELTQPILGICLGMQLLCANSEEGNTPALGVIDGSVTAFKDTPRNLHMGWNRVTGLEGALFEGIEDGSHFYFVHGYYVPKGAYTLGTTEFGNSFSAGLYQQNFYGVQFHPEKSGPMGAKLLSNFIKMKA